MPRPNLRIVPRPHPLDRWEQAMADIPERDKPVVSFGLLRVVAVIVMVEILIGYVVWRLW